MTLTEAEERAAELDEEIRKRLYRKAQRRAYVLRIRGENALALVAYTIKDYSTNDVTAL